ncbi:IS200/IS605 family transposase [Myxococcota bacterium]|nr:IS200/IS605 family transposase [Myxococcota bacterium]
MGHSFSCTYLHIVFSTSRRIPFFHDSEFRGRMHAFVGGIIRSLQCVPVEIGGPADHIHILLKIDRTHSIGEIVKEIKRISTIWVNNSSTGIQPFSWQTGYAVFSVSQSLLTAVRTYISKQMEHHSRLTFEQEFSLLLEKHGIMASTSNPSNPSNPG